MQVRRHLNGINRAQRSEFFWRQCGYDCWSETARRRMSRTVSVHL